MPTPTQRRYLRALLAMGDHAASTEEVRAHVHGGKRNTTGPTSKALNTLLRSGHIDTRPDEANHIHLFWLTETGELEAKGPRR